MGAVEGINAIMTGSLLTLSEQQVLDCFGAGDCSGGWPDQAQQYIVKNGITLDRCGKEPYYPAYDATKHPCRTVAGKQPIITVDDVKWVNKSEAALLLKVYQQPISVALDASGWDVTPPRSRDVTPPISTYIILGRVTSPPRLLLFGTEGVVMNVHTVQAFLQANNAKGPSVLICVP